MSTGKNSNLRRVVKRKLLWTYAIVVLNWWEIILFGNINKLNHWRRMSLGAIRYIVLDGFCVTIRDNIIRANFEGYTLPWIQNSSKPPRCKSFCYCCLGNANAHVYPDRIFTTLVQVLCGCACMTLWTAVCPCRCTVWGTGLQVELRFEPAVAKFLVAWWWFYGGIWV